MDLENLRRKAEQLLGNEVVNQIERKLEKSASGDPDVRELVDVRNVAFQSGNTQRNQDTRKPEDVGRVIIPATPDQSIDVGQSFTGPSAAERLIERAIRGEFIYAMSGLILGLACIAGGIILGLHGVTGSTSWTAKLFGLQSQINDAAPGVVLFIVGIFFVVATRPKVKLRDLK
jgi:hypothetical protein